MVIVIRLSSRAYSCRPCEITSLHHARLPAPTTRSCTNTNLERLLVPECPSPRPPPPDMAAHSVLRPSRAHIRQLARLYGSHRPLIQRLLVLGFIAHVLSSTYHSFTAKSSNSRHSKSSKGKEKAAEQSSGRKQRVAVSGRSYRTACTWSSSNYRIEQCVLDRCRVLSTALKHTENCYTDLALQGGSATCDAF